jgi:hypothetical protein
VDAGAAAPEGGLHGRLFGERCGGGDGLLSLVMWMAKREQRGILVLAMLRHRRLPDRALKAWLGGSGRSTEPSRVTKVFPSESSALLHQRRRCMRVSLPS